MDSDEINNEEILENLEIGLKNWKTDLI